MRIYSSGLESSALLCAAFPLFSPLLLSVQCTYIRAYIIRSIRYLMAVSVSDVYPTLRSSPPWPGRQVFLSNLVFLAHRARCVQRERAHECTRFTVLGASDAKHIPLFSIFAPREIGSRSAIDLDERWRGEDMLFFVPNHRSFLMLIDVSSAGRGREVVPRFATKGGSGQVAGGTKVPGRSNEAASGKQEAVAAAVSVYTQHSSVENEKKKGRIGYREREGERTRKRGRMSEIDDRETRAKEIHCRSDIDESK